jgi:hypothetical protein
VQQLDVSGVQNVEAAVSEHNPLAACASLRANCRNV